MDTALVKLCPACYEENPISEVICRVCMTNLASVPPTPKGGKPEPISHEAAPLHGMPDETKHAVLSLSRLSDGRIMSVADGTVLGRSGETGAFFDDERTVSRRHAKLDFHDGRWWIEDLNSLNGTWVNEKKLSVGLPHPLKVGDILSFSLACKLKVIA